MTGILTIDQGTTGTTVRLMTLSGALLQEHTEAVPLILPKPGLVEQDLDALWAGVRQGIASVMGRAPLVKVEGIGITNQRETVCFWDKITLRPLGHAIVWQDKRTLAACQAWIDAGKEPWVRQKTGLFLDPYFSASKIHYALETWSDVQTAAKAGRLAFGTIDTFLVAKLSGGASFVTEPSNASRTLLLDIHKVQFCPELCTLFGIDPRSLPELKPSFAKDYARTQGCAPLPDGTPITGVLGDQQSALLGQGCVEKGMAKCTYGTGAFVLVHTGQTPAESHGRLLTTIAWQHTENHYALEGSAFTAGAAVQWFCEDLGMAKDPAEVEAMAIKAGSSGGVVFVPALSGLGAPYWDPEALGLFCGLSRGTTKAHLARALLEGLACQTVDLLQAFEADLGMKLPFLRVDGGGSQNNFLMQEQADLLGFGLERPRDIETTSRGAWMAAGLGLGLWPGVRDIQGAIPKEGEHFKPNVDPEPGQKLMSKWRWAIKKAREQI